MHFEGGGDLFGELGHTNVLYDDGIDTGGGDGGDGATCFGQLMTKYQGVEGHIATHPTPMQGLHHIGELFEGKADFGTGSKVG